MKNIILTISLITGAGISSQAPEFAQQYRQRLGGALNELHVIAEQFDQDAKKTNLDRVSALNKLADSNDTFISARGTSMHLTFDRYAILQQQENWFNSLHPTARPLALISNFDQTLLNDTWQDYEPAIPLSLHGLIWTSVGGLVSLLVIWLLISILTLPFNSTKTSRRRSRKKARSTHKRL